MRIPQAIFKDYQICPKPDDTYVSKYSNVSVLANFKYYNIFLSLDFEAFEAKCRDFTAEKS